MTPKLFNEIYKSEGGTKYLIELRENLISLDNIAAHYGVTKERVRQWMVELFGEKYDPREERREKIIDLFAHLIKNHGEKEALRMYPQINRYYKKEAIKRAKNL